MRAWAVSVLVAVGCGRLGFDELGGTGAGANIIFVASTPRAPDQLGGLAGADALCAERAAAANLDGSFVAWMSTTTVDARERVGSARGWIRLDGLPFADTREDLLAGRILYPVALDELGRDIAGWPPVATGTNEQGNYDPGIGACGDWTSSAGQTWYGSAYSSSNGFTEYALNTCSEAMHVYCMGIDRQVPVAPVPQLGRRAFVADAWFPGGGLPGADTHCQQAASGAGLPGTFKALLATSTASASSRFDLQRAPWVRTDGIPLAETAADFMAGRRFTGLSVSANGLPHVGSDIAWTGADGTGRFEPDDSPTSDHCGDWADGAASGGLGCLGDTGTSFFDAAYTLTCEGAYPLYCLEE